MPDNLPPEYAAALVEIAAEHALPDGGLDDVGRMMTQEVLAQARRHGADQP